MKRKFLITLLTIIISLCSFGLVSCGDITAYSVYYVAGDSVYWQTVTFGKEQLILPDEPTQEGYNFGGWYLDIGTFEQEFTADYLKDIELTSDLVVFAKFTSAHVHSFTTEITTATCVKEGFTTYSCTCGESYIGNITSALGHVEQTVSSVSPTCTTGGLSQGSICTVCGEIVEAQDYTAPLGHDFGDFVSNNDASELADGTKTAFCQREDCEQTLTVTDEGTMLEQTGYTLTYMALGEVYLVDTFAEGEIPEIPTPEVAGRVFEGWFLDNGEWENPFTELYLEVEGIARQITVYAKFNASHEHTYQTADVDATCTEAGYTSNTCSCGFYYFDNFTSALGHDEVIDEAVEATCALSGLTEGKHCARCESVLVEQLEVTIPHTSELIPEILATCTTDGYTYGYKCSVCQTILTEPQLVEATGHNFTENVTPPTCDAMGSSVKVCSCGYSETTTEEALGHLFTNYISNGDATNFKDGTKTAVCDREGCSATQVITDEGSMLSPTPSATINITFYADGEEYSTIQTQNDKTVTLPTPPVKEGKTFDGWYVDDGVYTQPFLLNYLLENEITTDLSIYAKFSDAHEHSYSDIITTPSCTEQGFTTHACVCGESFIDTFTIATGHDEVILPYLAPTCTATGLTQGKTCAVCSQVLIAQTEISAKGHTKVVLDAVMPTCTATGLTQGVTCSTCSETLVQQLEIEATGHNHAVSSKVEPDCINDGHTVYTCACGDYYTTTQDALGHLFGEYISNGDASYTADGTKTATCTREGCDEQDTVVDEGSMLVHSHSYSAIVYEPTCTEGGYTKHLCSCGDFYIDGETDTLTHSFTNYVSNGNGTMTAVCDNRGCSATDVKTDEAPTVITKVGYLEDFGSEMVEDSEYHETIQADGSTKVTYTEYKHVVDSRIFLSYLQLPAGNYTATFNGESIGEITVGENREADLGYLPSYLTLGETYTLRCVSERGKVYEQQMKYVSRAIDSGEELLRAVTYYNQYLDQAGNYSYQYNISASSFRSEYLDARQFYNGSTFSQRYYVLTTDITITDDLVSYGVGGTYDIRNPHCDLYRQHFSYWFDYIDGQGHTVSIERFVDGGLFGHVSQGAVIKNLCVSPFSTWWNQVAVETKVVLGMSVASNATVENVVLLVNLETTLGGINPLAYRVYGDAKLKNIFINIPSSVTFVQNENTASFMQSSGYIACHLNTTNIENIVVLSPNFKHACVRNGVLVGADNQDYDEYLESCYYFSDADFLLNSGRGVVGPWYVMSDGSAKFYAQRA